MLYVRGAVVGLGLGYGLSPGTARAESMLEPGRASGSSSGSRPTRGSTCSATPSRAATGRGRVQSWRVYLVQALLGGFDRRRRSGSTSTRPRSRVVVDKFHRYVDPGQTPRPLRRLSAARASGGFIRLGDETGGASLLFAEALAGVISWSIPSWLFAINRTFMAAYFDKDADADPGAVHPGRAGRSSSRT